jgi:hypothetical protein
MKTISPQNYVTLDDFVIQPTEAPKWDAISLDELMNRNLLLQMMDIWGEADKAVQAYLSSNTEATVKQLSNFHDVCNIIYSNPSIDNDTKWELKVAEWELYDFCLWDNSFHNDSSSVMKWFDQWCYDINHDLLIDN